MSAQNIRSVEPRSILRSFGKILNSRKTINQDDNSGRIKPVETIDVFISHVWSSSPLSRYLGILWYFNGQLVVITGLVLVICVNIVTMASVDGRSWVKMETLTYLTIGSIFAISFTVLFFFLMTSIHWLNRLVRKPAACFLDRCCIDQTDEETKLKGVHLIPHILANTKCLLVLLTDTYFERLWCCYEIAVFKSGLSILKDIVIIPIRVVLVTIVIIVVDLLGAILFRSSLRTTLSKKTSI